MRTVILPERLAQRCTKFQINLDTGSDSILIFNENMVYSVIFSSIDSHRNTPIPHSIHYSLYRLIKTVFLSAL